MTIHDFDIEQVPALFGTFVFLVDFSLWLRSSRVLAERTRKGSGGKRVLFLLISIPVSTRAPSAGLKERKKERKVQGRKQQEWKDAKYFSKFHVGACLKLRLISIPSESGAKALDRSSRDGSERAMQLARRGKPRSKHQTNNSPKA